MLFTSGKHSERKRDRKKYLLIFQKLGDSSKDLDSSQKHKEPTLS